MSITPHRPLIHDKVVAQALEAMRSGRPLGGHPLKYFLCVLEKLESPDMLTCDSAVEVAVFDLLAEIITSRLDRLRNNFGIPPPDGLCSSHHLRADFQQNSKELEAWSLLYHRYICVEQGLAMQELIAQVHHEERTARRRQQLGLTRLTQTLIRREQQARRQARLQRLRLALPLTSPPVLYGTDGVMSIGQHFLEHGDPPRHVVLHGSPGIGKTALALALAHWVIERQQTDDVLWLHVPDLPLVPDKFAAEFAARLSLPLMPDVPPDQILRAYLFTHTVLIILDSAEAISGNPALAERVLTLLESARVLVTSRIAVPDGIWCYQITLPELERGAAFTLVEQLVGQKSSASPGWIERFDTLWEAVGGNPQALRLLTGASDRLPLTEALALKTEELYGHLWMRLTPDQRRVWLVALLFSQDSMPYEYIHSLTDLDQAAINRALDGLVSTALLVPLSEGGLLRYSLQPAAVSFLIEHTRRGLAIASHEPASAFLCRAFRRRIRYVQHTFQAGTAVALLKLAWQIGLEDAERWRFASELSAVITAANLWHDWLQELGVLMSDSHLPDQKAWLHYSLGVALRWTGQLEQAVEHLRQAESMYLAGSVNQADILVELSVVTRYQKRFADAHTYSLMALGIYQRIRSSGGVERCIQELAQLAFDAGNCSEALDWLDKLEIWSARAWGIASQANWGLGQLAEALHAAEESVQRLPVQHPHRGRAVGALAQVYDAMGESDMAVDKLLMAADLLEQAKDTIGAARTYNNLAVAYLRQPPGQRTVSQAEIQRLLLTALEMQEYIGHETGWSVTQQNLDWLSALDASDDIQSIVG